MALRRMITNKLFPGLEGLEQSLSRSVRKEIESVAPMLDSCLEPQAYGFVQKASHAGAFRSSGLRAQPVPAMKKMTIPVKQVGLFH